MRPDGRPVLCLITDRRRLTAALGLDPRDWRDALLAQIDGAIRGGVDVVQIREGDVPAGDLLAFARRAVAAAAGSPTRVILNDRPDLALAADAAGVHLREDGVPTGAARRLLGPSRVIGRSVHGVEGVEMAGAADYLIAGTVFSSESKPGARPLGLDGLRTVVERALPRPVWAVGGITTGRLGLVRDAGAHGMAAIGAFIPAAGAHDLTSEVQKLTKDLRFCFDSSAAPS